MSKEIKEKIDTLSNEGKRGSDIALELGLSYNTVKSYLRRQRIKTKACKEVIKGTCLTCGKELTQPIGKKHKSFCSDYCRVKYWRAHARTRV